MSIAHVRKIYDNEEEIKEYNSFRKQISKEQDVIHQILKSGELLARGSSIFGKLNALDAVWGMLKELTPEQIKLFDESVKRRPAFR